MAVARERVKIFLLRRYLDTSGEQKERAARKKGKRKLSSRNIVILIFI